MVYSQTYRTKVIRGASHTCLIFSNEGLQTRVDLNENHQFSLGYRIGYNFDYECQSDLEDAIALVSSEARNMGMNTATNIILQRIYFPDGSYKIRVMGYYS